MWNKKLEEIMSLLIIVLSLLLIIEILIVQNKQYIALKVSKNDFILSVNGKDIMTNFMLK